MASYSGTVELRGHIIDSLVLPQIMEEVMDRGGEFVIQQIDVGRRKDEPSFARIQISAPTPELRDLLLDRAQRIGATLETAVPVGGRAGAARRRLPRGLLLHHQPADGGVPGRPAGWPSSTRRWTARSRSIPERAGPGRWR